MTTNALIVDDSRLACKVLANMLESYDIISTSLHCAEDALDYLKTKKPDMIFLDHSMPGMDGLEAVKLIKNNPQTAMIPVLMYTAKEGEVYFGHARSLGAVDILPKGMEKDRLQQALTKLGLLNSESSETSLSIEHSVEKDEEKQISQNEQDERSAIPESVPDVAEEMAKEKQNNAEDLAIEWFKIWRSQLQPYLNKVNAQQLRELRQTTAKQTSYLTREVHQTLEHFEQVVACRLEMMTEVTRTEQQMQRFKSRIGLSIAACFVLGIQGALFWQLQSTQLKVDYIAAQSTQYSSTAVARAHQSKPFHSQQQDTDQDTLAFADDESRWQEDEKTKQVDNAEISGELPRLAKMTLSNDRGEAVGEVYRDDSSRVEFSGVTDTGYHFLVSPQGKIGWPLPERYYLSSDCQGDIYIESLPGLIYRDQFEKLWYVEKNVVAMPMNVFSKIDGEGGCASLDAQQISLVSIQLNNSLETAFSEADAYQLVVN